jgi:anti-sigma B factor antagonist
MSDSPSFQPTIEVRSPQPHAALVVLGGEHDLYSADQLQQTFDETLAGSDLLIVDLSAAEFIDSTIIGVLVETMKKADELDRKFIVVLGTAPAVERILDVTGVLPLLNVVPTVERALAA